MSGVIRRRGKKRKPSFFWQAVLILLPVIILAGVGFFSLRQDRLLASKEAQERARAIADDLLPRLEKSLTDTNAGSNFIFQVNKDGALVYPPQTEALPQPKPLPVTELSPDQVKSWNELQTAQFRDNGSNATAACKAFLDSSPPREFAAIATYALGVALLRSLDSRAAMDAFAKVLENYADCVTESGLPLAQLADFKILSITELVGGNVDRSRLETSRGQSTNSLPRITTTPLVTVEGFCSNLLSHPSPLTPQLLDELELRISDRTNSGALVRAAIQCAKAQWTAQERSRGLYRAARLDSAFGALTMFWFGNSENGRTAFRLVRISGNGDAGIRPDSSAGASSPGAEVKGGRERSSREQIGFDHETLPSPRGFTAYSQAAWLATEIGPNDGRYLCRSKSNVQEQIDSVASDKTWPEYMSVSFVIAGETMLSKQSDLRPWKMVYGVGKGPYARKEFLNEGPIPLLASNAPTAALLASAAHGENGVDLLKVNVYLTSPDTLFKRQTARTFWFGVLIAASSVAAFVGLATAWHVFSQEQRLSEMKSNFVSSVSHELRSPIAAVRLMAENLEHGKVDAAKQGEYFHFIGQECRRLSGLIQNVLDFARIEQGRQEYDFEPTDTRALVEGTVALMQTYASEKRVNLSFAHATHEQSAGESFEFNIDGRAIQQALINLIDNAIKHSSPGSDVLVGLESRASSSLPSPSVEDRENGPLRSTRSLLIWVEDKGQGIPLEEQGKIFERFYRIGSELRRETEGVGIGLSIVKHVVEAHGGKISVRSAPGEGSRFLIDLPSEPTSEETTNGHESNRCTSGSKWVG